jgi:hypothetical protein
MEQVAFKGDWFDAGLALEALGTEWLPGVVGEENDGTLGLRREYARVRDALRAWLEQWHGMRSRPRS